MVHPLSNITIFYNKLQYTRFFLYKQHFYKQRQAGIGKNYAKTKQHPEAELSLFENYSLFIYVIIQK